MLCSGCNQDLDPQEFHNFRGRRRGVASRCKKCRSEERFAKIYLTRCEYCLHFRPLDKNGNCQGCNADQGIRQCNTCSHLLPLFFAFYGGSKRCKYCKKDARTSNRTVASSE